MKHDWWKDAVVYQIYPRSFQDSNGDGIGDLPGIIQRLDYIRQLGADVIWLCPVYASPNADNGYDISDYRAIHPDFGTMADFDRLLKQAHQRGLRVVMDLVVNHTSDEHFWFQQSRAAEKNKYRDYYIWQKEKPNDWGSWFGGDAWEYDEQVGEYYLHIFAKKQPDLNWRNPAVREEIYDMMAWWLNKGVDGFRMDVISLLSKPADFSCTDGGDLSPYCINGPHIHEYMKEMNARVLSHYDLLTVGECPGVTVEEAKKYAGFSENELNMVFQFEHTGLTDGAFGKWTDAHTDLVKLKQVFAHWQTGLHGLAWNCLFWGNHDQPRAVSKFGCELPEFRARSAKMLCACLYLMQGTAFIYQGEELGMPNPCFSDIEQYRDIESINAYHNFVDSGTLDKRTMLQYLACASRDNARTPMQWSRSYCAGFTTGTPWLGMGYSWRAVNAEQQLSDPDSVYRFYQKLLLFRKDNPVVRDGVFKLLLPEHPKLFAYTRTLERSRILVLCNFSQDTIALQKTVLETCTTPILSNYPDCGISGQLRPYEARIYKN